MENAPKARPSSFPEEIWTAAFNRVSQQIRPYFVRTESRSSRSGLSPGSDESSFTKKRMASGGRDGRDYPVCDATPVRSSQVGL
jgi:hypothetical protein